MALLDGVVTLAAGEAKVFELHRGIRLTLIPASSAVVTYSRVDDADASAHVNPVSSTADVIIDADWPYYRISSATAATRVAMI